MIEVVPQYSVEELMNLPSEKMARLERLLLSNSDEDTNDDEWARRGVEDAEQFVLTSAGAITLLLGGK